MTTSAAGEALELNPGIPLSAGASATPLQVPDGTFLAGYGRDRRAMGSHDLLQARTVVISDTDTMVALVSVDNIGLTRPDVQALQQLTVKALGAEGVSIQPAHIIVSSTHTHAGPDVVGLWGRHLFSSGRDANLMTQWRHSIAQGIVRAAQARKPALVRAASAATPQPWVENRSEPDSLDTTLSTLGLTDAETGAVIATITNYACHPTVLGPDNQRSSADWVSGFYQTMAASQSGVHLFLQGAVGGWVQPIQNERTIAEARSYGASLAHATLALQGSAPTEARAAIEIATATTHFELDNFGFQLLMLLGVMDRPTETNRVPADIAWLRVGRSQFVTHPGETVPAYSLATRAMLETNEPTFVLGLTQDALGYILRPEFFADDAPYPDAEYLTSVSLGVSTGPTLMRALDTLLRSRTTNGTAAPSVNPAKGSQR